MSARHEHIAVVGPAHPYRGGIAHFSDALADALRARGHRVRIHTFSRQYPSPLFPGETQLEGSLDALPEGTSARLDSINPATWIREAQRIAGSGATIAVIAYWLPFFAPAYTLMARLLRRRGIRVVGLVHNALPHKRHAGDALLSRVFFRSCHQLIALSGSVAADLESLDVNVPTYETSHPVYSRFGDSMDRAEARRRLDLAPSDPIILFFGFIRRYKGLHVLIEAMPEIVRAVPEIRLVVAGEFYEDEDALRRRVRELALEPHIRFDARYIAQDDVAAYFAAADLVVQPYIHATQSGVAQIAFHFDRPLVVTDVGGLAEVVPHERAGLVVPPEDPQALARAVIRYFEDGLEATLIEGVRRQKQRHDWSALCRAIENAAT